MEETNLTGVRLRERCTRKAKDKACIEIKNYFMKKSQKLETIPEDSVDIINKNNKNKRNFTRRSLENNPGDKDKIGDSKRTKIQSTKSVATKSKNDTAKKQKPNEKESTSEAKKAKKTTSKSKPESKKNGLLKAKKTAQTSVDKIDPKTSTKNDSRNSSTSSSDLEIVLDNSVESNNIIILDSSIDSTVQDESRIFDDLQTDDPTEFEEGDTFKPYWSIHTNRVAIVIDQYDVTSKIVDSFFGSKAESVILQDIFPNSVPMARRRSTAFWNTPPRYSMLPKY